MLAFFSCCLQVFLQRFLAALAKKAALGHNVVAGQKQRIFRPPAMRDKTRPCLPLQDTRGGHYGRHYHLKALLALVQTQGALPRESGPADQFPSEKQRVNHKGNRLPLKLCSSPSSQSRDRPFMHLVDAGDKFMCLAWASPLPGPLVRKDVTKEEIPRRLISAAKALPLAGALGRASPSPEGGVPAQHRYHRTPEGAGRRSRSPGGTVGRCRDSPWRQPARCFHGIIALAGILRRRHVCRVPLRICVVGSGLMERLAHRPGDGRGHVWLAPIAGPAGHYTLCDGPRRAAPLRALRMVRRSQARRVCLFPFSPVCFDTAWRWQYFPLSKLRIFYWNQMKFESNYSNNRKAIFWRWKYPFFDVVSYYLTAIHFFSVFDIYLIHYLMHDLIHYLVH